jgi:hypothetical protein
LSDATTRYRDADLEVVKNPAPVAQDWSKQRHFDMSFEEQQEVLLKTLMAFQQPE